MRRYATDQCPRCPCKKLPAMEQALVSTVVTKPFGHSGRRSEDTDRMQCLIKVYFVCANRAGFNI